MSTNQSAPELERTQNGNMLSGSWVIVQRATRDPVKEIFDQSLADHIARNAPKYEVLTSYQWLTEFNRSINQQ